MVAADMSMLITDLHASSKIIKVDLSKLRVDLSYERDPSRDLVDRITGDWNILAAGILLVSNRGAREGNEVEGGLFLVDGQHRVSHAETAEEAADEISSGVVGLDETEDVIALLGERQQGLRDRAHTGARHEAFLTALELGDEQLELPRRRVGGARVEESRALASQKALGLLDAVELEFDGLVDGRHHRMVVRRQLNLRRMIDSSGLLHGFKDPTMRVRAPV